MASSEKEFAEALKEQYNKELESERNLDSKATSTLSIAGAVSGLMFGFGTFLVSRLEPNYELADIAIIVLVATVVMNIISVGLAFLASKARRYYYVMGSGGFFQKEGYSNEQIKQAKNYDVQQINTFKNMTSDEFNDMLIHDYLTSSQLNHATNHHKAMLTIAAQIPFLIGLGLIPLLLWIVFQAYNASAIRLP